MLSIVQLVIKVGLFVLAVSETITLSPEGNPVKSLAGFFFSCPSIAKVTHQENNNFNFK